MVRRGLRSGGAAGSALALVALLAVVAGGSASAATTAVRGAYDRAAKRHEAEEARRRAERAARLRDEVIAATRTSGPFTLPAAPAPVKAGGPPSARARAPGGLPALGPG